MIRTRGWRIRLGTASVLSACVVTLAWLGTLFVIPDRWYYDHGPPVCFMLAASVSHFGPGLGLVVAAGSGHARKWFSLLVLLTPWVHWVGSMTEWPLCLIPLVGPSVVILYAAALWFRPGRGEMAR